jgi:hypothetical protein
MTPVFKFKAFRGVHFFILPHHTGYQRQQISLAILQRNTLYVKTALSNLEEEGKN